MLPGFGGEIGAWAATISRPIAPAVWHPSMQVASVDCAPPGWSFRPGGAGLTKLMLSWHAPQARRLGTFFQLSAIGAGLLGAGLRWHLAQLRMSCGYVVSYGCGTPA